MHKKNYIKSIDGLRGISVLAVLAFHFFPNYVPGGFVGVDIFFVISGYLISNIILRDLNSCAFSFKNFFFNRVIRIFPALIIVFLFCLFLGWFSLFPDEYYNLAKHVFSSNFFFLNYILQEEGGYFDTEVDLKPLLHLWSLSIEEQFYIIWPFILFFLYKKKNFLQILVFFLLISFCINIYLSEIGHLESFYSSIGRFWEILFGFFLSYYLSLNSSKYNFIKKNKNKFTLVSLVVIILCFFLFNETIKFPGWSATIPVIAISLILITLNEETAFQKKILSNKILVWFGLISYPLYLWHFPILSYYIIIYGHLPNLPSKIVLIIVSIIISWTTFYFIERPIRFGDNKKIKVLTLFFCSLLLVFFSYEILRKQGFNLRVNIIPSEAKILYQPYPHAPLKNLFCTNKYKEFKNFNSCLLSNNTNEPEILILGDSHAQQYYKSFVNFFPKKTILNLSEFSCFPFVSDYHFNKKNCKKSTQQILEFLEKNNSIETIVITGYFNYLSSNEFVYKNGSRKPSPYDKNTYDTFAKNGEIFLNKIKILNKKILIIKDIPNLNFHPKNCIEFEKLNLRKFYSNIKQKKLDSCAFDLEEHEFENYLNIQNFNNLISKFKFINIFDPKSILCNSKNCFAFMNDEAIYYNEDHLTFLGSSKIVNKIRKSYPFIFENIK